MADELVASAEVGEALEPLAVADVVITGAVATELREDADNFFLRLREVINTESLSRSPPS